MIFIKEEGKKFEVSMENVKLLVFPRQITVYHYDHQRKQNISVQEDTLNIISEFTVLKHRSYIQVLNNTLYVNVEDKADIEIDLGDKIVLYLNHRMLVREGTKIAFSKNVQLTIEERPATWEVRLKEGEKNVEKRKVRKRL